MLGKISKRGSSTLFPERLFEVTASSVMMCLFLLIVRRGQTGASELSLISVNLSRGWWL